MTYKDELEIYLKHLQVINKSRLDEIHFIERGILFKGEEIIHINDQIEVTKRLINQTKKELKNL